MAPETGAHGPEKPRDMILPAARISVWRRILNYFLAGLVLTGPIAITLWLTWIVVGWIDGWFVPLIPAWMNPSSYLPFALPGLGLIAAFVVITLVGFVFANFVGRRLFGFGERIVARVPVISSLYNALKQIFDTLITQRGTSFKHVGLIEYPRKGVYAMVLVASDVRGELAHRLPSDDMLSVFMPTTPNPTTGFLMFLPRSEVTILEMSVEDGAKLLISAGLVVPPYLPSGAAVGAPGPLVSPHL